MKNLKGAQFEYFKMKKIRTEYYLGKASDEAYQKEPLDHKVLKTDLDLYINPDDVLNRLEGIMASQKMKVEMLEKFTSSLYGRGFNIKTALDFLKFKGRGV